MSATIAKVFTSGNSQAIRLPKKFRFSVDEVYISKENNKLIIVPKNKKWESKEEIINFFSAVHCPDFKLSRKDSKPQKRNLF
ncbi:antitoxin [Endomicrobium proavitum]|uniref:Virulence-associated protein B n=1 Tax=Endomicrobium proavitum TaxID=1408281 RepID=A0A0G3WJ07_9BACT|nr:type II toxin-antitoxin system VapB family antitoxin [Endomicrobium proavitum]AKL97867.1 Virulence-associated protein B [Endomicrobium proavitum]